jgi:FixJ family two-component response regulator
MIERPYFGQRTRPFDLERALTVALQRDRAAQERRAEIRDLQERYDVFTSREREVMTQVVAGMLRPNPATIMRDEITWIWTN